MQGRLSAPENGRFQSFPRNHWRTEIERAPQVPLRGIEWIYDLYGSGANPLETAEGRADLRQQLTASGVSVVSICADYFMDRPFVRVSREECLQRRENLAWLISICPEMGIGRIVLPFVDASRIADAADASVVLECLRGALPQAEAAGVELHLETDLDPLRFRALLDNVPHPLVKVNYDSGNSGSLGYRPQDEFAAYGSRIGSFHIKDRALGGGTVPLGSGNVNFTELRQCLLDVDYRGDFVMQVARGASGNEVDWLREASATACGWLRGDATLK
ncbi:sugar phosphate isomerase/epimerase family protein [Panacagrimonas perspica]|nr:sugar phosphate isomerase/epimerase family protein [Panacagrimonas perspica]